MGQSTDASRATVALSTPIAEVPGVRKGEVKRFARLGIQRAADLVKHLPHRWAYHAGQTPIVELREGINATVIGEIAQCRWVPGGGRGRGGNKGRFEAIIDDGESDLHVAWFNQRYLTRRLHPAMRIGVTGKVTFFRNVPQMANPKWRLLDEPPEAPESPESPESPEDDAPDPDAAARRSTSEDPTVADDERYRPVYPATEGLSSERIEQVIAGVLPVLLEQIEDHLPEDFRQQRAMPALAGAYRMLHQPADEDEVAAGRRRLAYDDLLLLQTALTMKRQYTRTRLQAPTLRYSDAIDQHIRDRFPFPLTDAQDKVVREIAADLQRAEPMNRLLQGDVGSGKTVVALYAMLMAVASRRQAALMAPTELLAEQHHLAISAMLEEANVRVALLTGSLPAADRAAIREQIAAGEVDLVIGTQALLTDATRFHDLAVVVIDEQHRFGVMQRAALKDHRPADAESTDDQQKNERPTVPHTLVMTATPIPRTLSLTLFGDLDVSTIDQLPPGRQPIITRVVGPEKTKDVYRYCADRVAKGEQLYVVVPAVEEGQLNLKAVRSHVKELEGKWFADRTVAAVHGQLKRQSRERIMDRFRRGEIDVLVATTVIEVGVDVPNASLMVVEHAERFGLAQLHQLRGRVGRGTTRSLCVFINEPTTEDAAERMKAIAKTTDGFRIAEADLEIRGMGELIGTRQAGLPPLAVARIPRDMDLLNLARRDARTLIETDPTLHDPQYALLRQRLLKQFGEALGLSDVA